MMVMIRLSSKTKDGNILDNSGHSFIKPKKSVKSMSEAVEEKPETVVEATEEVVEAKPQEPTKTKIADKWGIAHIFSS